MSLDISSKNIDSLEFGPGQGMETTLDGLANATGIARDQLSHVFADDTTLHVKEAGEAWGVDRSILIIGEQSKAVLQLVQKTGDNVWSIMGETQTDIEAEGSGAEVENAESMDQAA